MLLRTVGTSVQSLKTREYLDPWVIIPLVIAGLAIFGLAWWTTQDFSLVGYYAIGVIAAYLLLSFAGRGLQWVLRRLPALPNATLRNAFRGIYRPGSPAPTVIMSLGLGLAMLLVIVILSVNLHDQLIGQVTKDAPTFVATDLFDDEVVDLQDFLNSTGQVTEFQHSPMLRAAITKVNGVPSEQIRHRKDISGEAAYKL